MKHLFVPYETALKLKEKGFDEPCRYVHDTWNNIKDWLEGGEGEHRNSHQNGSLYYSAPTIAEVVMWLYEKHEIWISTIPYNDEELSQTLWENTTIHIADNYNDFSDYTFYHSPTEAYSQAIEYTLKNLI